MRSMYCNGIDKKALYFSNRTTGIIITIKLFKVATGSSCLAMPIHIVIPRSIIESDLRVCFLWAIHLAFN